MTLTTQPQQFSIWRTGFAMLFVFASGVCDATVTLVPATALHVVSIEVDGKSVNELAQPSIGSPSTPIAVAKLVVNAPIVRGVLVTTSAAGTLTLKSTNGTIIRVEPGSELFVDAVIAGGEVYDLRSGVAHFETAQPLRFLVVRQAEVFGVAQEAKFKAEVIQAGKVIRYTVERGVLNVDERVWLIGEATKHRFAVREINTLKAGDARYASDEDINRKQTRFDTISAVETFVGDQLKAAEASSDIARIRLALRNALLMAVYRNRVPVAVAYNNQWLATADDNLLLSCQNAFDIANVCRRNSNSSCAISNNQKALGFAEQLYPDGLHSDILQIRRALTSLYVVGDDQKEYDVLSAQTRQILASMPSEKITAPSVAKRGPIKFPKSMSQWGFQGDGLIEAMITAKGKAKDIKVMASPHPAFEQAMVKMVLASEFNPATKEDKAISIRAQIPMPFRFEGNTDGSLSARDVPFAFPKASDPNAPTYAQYDAPPKIAVAAPVVYPRELLQKGVTGVAKVLVSLDAKGRVYSVAIIDTPNPEFGAATKAMIEAWEYQPATKNGKPIAIVFTFSQKFRRTEQDTGVNDHTKTLLKALAANNSEIAELDALDSRPNILYQPQPVDMRTGTAVPEEVVTIEFFIDPEGFVQLPRIVSANNMDLGWAAATAMKRWIYEVPTIKGKPVFVRRELQFTFK